ncbi:MAG: acyl-CoA dehydrogenase family protein [Alphaproteobacteria bacterium]|nr:acyl-CoA dehydrogenase family protein [Alphaproteobacteria bacterium]
MNLLYTDKENAYREELRAFLNQELAPIAAHIEETDEVPFDFMRKLGAKGYMGILHSKKYGGNELGLIYDHIVSEEICYHSAAVDIIRAQSTLYFASPISRWGTEKQKTEILPGIIRAEKFGSIAITEPRGGSDAAYMTTRADTEGDGFVLNGEKTWITNAGFADFLCVFAITDTDAHPHQGMTAFLVRTNNPGFKILRKIETMGVRGGSHCHIQFENCVIPGDDVIGEVNRGWEVLTDELASERVDIASRGLGCARRAFEEAVRYTAHREQFRKKIREFEGVSFKIADMKVALEAMRLLIIRAARQFDEGQPTENEAAIAKLFASEASFRIADDAMQVHGAYGYSKDAEVEKIFRDTRVYGFGGGTSEIMRYLIQREVYKEFDLL